MDERVGIVQDLMKDESFVRELSGKVELEEIQALFESKGVSFTLDELRQIFELSARIQSGEIDKEQLEKALSGELSEDELEEIAGGIIISSAICFVFIGAAFAAGVYFYFKTDKGQSQ